MQHIMHDFMASVLIHKPDDVFSFTNTYFTAMARPTTANLIEKEKAMKESIRHFIVISGAYWLCQPQQGSQYVAQSLKELFPEVLERALTYTTRPARKNEVHGVHHYFISKEEFSLWESNMDALHDEFGYRYGLATADVNNVWKQNMIAFSFVNGRGALTLQENFTTKGSKCFIIYVKPPSDVESFSKSIHERNVFTLEQVQQVADQYHNDEDIVPEFDAVIDFDELQDPDAVFEKLLEVVKEYIEAVIR